MVWIPRKTMMAAGQDQYELVLQYLFAGTSAYAPRPPVDTSGNNHVTTLYGATYQNDADTNAYQAMGFGSTYGSSSIDNVAAVRQAISTDIFYGGGKVGFDFYANGYGGNNTGRIVDERNSVNNYGWAIFIHNSSVAVAFIMQDSTGFKLWRMTNPLSLSTWYTGNTLEFDSSDKANVPVIRIGGGAPEALTEVANTTGGATGRWEAEPAPGTEKIYIGNISSINRGWDGIIDNIELYKPAG